MSTTAVMLAETLELSRRALIADLGATLGEHAEFRDHAEIVSTAMPPRLASAIHHRGWIVEPHGGDVAQTLARRYGHGRRRQSVIAVFLREAAAALQFAPPEFSDPHDWAMLMLMNVGSLAYMPAGQSAGVTRRPSLPALGRRERGCRAIARRGASRCIVCGTSVQPTPVGGAVLDRKNQPFTCSARCAADERYHLDAMATVFDRCAWLADEAMVLRIELLPH